MQKLIDIKNHILSGVFLLVLCDKVSAYEFTPASSTSSTNLGSAAEHALGPLNLLRKGFSLAGVLIGVYFLMSAYFRFQRFRENPQETPISTVIIYIILGLIFIVLPLAYHYSAATAQEAGMSDVAV